MRMGTIGILGGVIGWAAAAETALTSPVTFEKIQAFLKDDMTVADLVAALPDEFKQNWILMTRSESAQRAPRFLLQSRDAKVVLSVSLAKRPDGKYRDNTVEMIEWDDTKKEFKFRFFELDGRKAKADPEPKDCAGCHAGRPNWDAYDSWANMLPFNRDKIFEGSVEEKEFVRLVKALADDPRLQALELPEGVTVTPDGRGGYDVEIKYTGAAPKRTKKLPGGQEVEQGGNFLLFAHEGKGKGGDDPEGRGVALFDNLTALNAQRVARELKEHPNYSRYRYVVMALLDGCTGPEAGPGGEAASGIGKKGAVDSSLEIPGPDSLLEDLKKKDGAHEGSAPGGVKAKRVDLKAFIPEKVLEEYETYHKMSLDKLVEATRALQKKLPAEKATMQRALIKQMLARHYPDLTDEQLEIRATRELARRNTASFDSSLSEDGTVVDRESYFSTALIASLRFILEPEGVEVNNWSMGVLGRSNMYNFADLWGQYQSNIERVLREDLEKEGYKGRDCGWLERKSFAAYRSVDRKDPGETPAGPEGGTEEGH